MGDTGQDVYWKLYFIL